MEEGATKVVAKEAPIKPGIDVWIEGIDALREFVSLLDAVAVMRLGPDDIVVLKVKAKRLSMDMADTLREQAKEVFGDERRIAILDSDVDITVVSGEDAAAVRCIDKAEYEANLTGKD